MISWSSTDRMNRVAFYLCLAVATALATPILAGATSLPLMVGVLVLVYQAWRLAVARAVSGRLDASGVAKQLGPRSWKLAWTQVSAARFTTFLGSSQLVLTSTGDASWNPSDRLLGRLPRGSRALQVEPGDIDRIAALLGEHGVPIG
ncbi:MAG: hypothetical protein WAL91_04510 [Propionicimonas sp.]